MIPKGGDMGGTRLEGGAPSWDMQARGCGMAGAVCALELECWRAFAAMPDEPDTAGHFACQALADGNGRCCGHASRTGDGTRAGRRQSLSLLPCLQPTVSREPGQAGRPAAAARRVYATLALDPLPGRPGRECGWAAAVGIMTDFLAHYKGERLLLCPGGPAAGRASATTGTHALRPENILTEKRNFTMKKAAFATALLTACFLSACGSQKTDSNDLCRTNPPQDPRKARELDPEFSVDDEDTGETAERSRTRS